MSRFHTEFSRLYAVPAQASSEQESEVATDDTVKAMVLELARPADWAALSVVWQAAQTELELPAAAIAVSGTDGLQLWFSVLEPVSATEATDFLMALQAHYLNAIPSKRISLYPSLPSADAAKRVRAREVPAVQDGTGNWSAFVSPDLASVFGEEPWLDIPPNLDQQADILSRLKSMKVSQFRHALERLRTTQKHEAPTASSAAVERHPSATPLSGRGTGTMGPKEFLMQVMNDPAAGLRDRIEAAKALLPYVG